MGARCSRRAPADVQPTLHDFSVLRSIGRGAFGKVCIVRHRATRQHYAMKYMSKRRCVQRAAVTHVLRELELLADLVHPLLVNLCFTFQDENYMYMVSELLLGGDLRFHLNQQGRFSEDRAKLYLCEIALALDYLHERRIMHRDVKPDNVLLDDGGHAHLSDLNLATRLESGQLATSFSGTRPYMAPEILMTSLEMCPGYDLRVDWWSLGVTLMEMLRGRRPYEFGANVSSQQVLHMMLDNSLTLPAEWSSDLQDFIIALLQIDPDRRMSRLIDLKRHRYMQRIDLNAVLAKKTAPVFVPRSDWLNCDPTFELEERIIESSPLRNRRRRPSASTANSLTHSKETLAEAIAECTAKFKPYVRQQPNKLVNNNASMRKLVNSGS